MKVSQAIFQTSGQGFAMSDLLLSQQMFRQNPTPNIIRPVNTKALSSCYDANRCLEGNVDLQYITAVAHNASTYFWYMLGNSSSKITDDVFVNFLYSVMISPNPPTSLSISYGSDEHTYTPSHKDAFNNLALKLGLMGITIFVASGDNGVAGNLCKCNLNSGSSGYGGVFWKGNNKWSGIGYIPIFPATRYIYLRYLENLLSY